MNQKMVKSLVWILFNSAIGTRKVYFFNKMFKSEDDEYIFRTIPVRKSFNS